MFDLYPHPFFVKEGIKIVFFFQIRLPLSCPFEPVPCLGILASITVRPALFAVPRISAISHAGGILAAWLLAHGERVKWHLNHHGVVPDYVSVGIFYWNEFTVHCLKIHTALSNSFSYPLNNNSQREFCPHPSVIVVDFDFKSEFWH
jgi:hypothetical protein